MNLLIFEWNGLMQPTLESALLDHHCHFRRFSYCFHDDNQDAFFEERFAKHLSNHQYDAVISFNFFPLVSNICEQFHIPYLAWCYDSPVRLLNKTALANSCNYVFMFDQREVSDYQKQGFTQVYHMPLAVYPKQLKKQLQIRHPEYACDVSFIGNLHHGNFTDFVIPLSDYDKGYLQGLINLQRNLSGNFVLDFISVRELLERFNPVYQRYTNNPDYELSEENFSFLFGKYVTEQERLYLLKAISQVCEMHVYSNASDQIPDSCVYRGTADYFREMPYIFHESKINLNPTFHCIRSGIPLRALDIMASKGFLLCNAQEEMFSYFTPFEDFVFYDSVNQAADLVKYYLAHDDLREQIAANGQQKCFDLFSYDKILPQMFEIAGLI